MLTCSSDWLNDWQLLQITIPSIGVLIPAWRPPSAVCTLASSQASYVASMAHNYMDLEASGLVQSLDLRTWVGAWRQGWRHHSRNPSLTASQHWPAHQQMRLQPVSCGPWLGPPAPLLRLGGHCWAWIGACPQLAQSCPWACVDPSACMWAVTDGPSVWLWQVSGAAVCCCSNITPAFPTEGPGSCMRAGAPYFTCMPSSTAQSRTCQRKTAADHRPPWPDGPGLSYDQKSPRAVGSHPHPPKLSPHHGPAASQTRISATSNPYGTGRMMQTSGC